MTLAVPDSPQVFERGDKLYITAQVQVFNPTESAIEEYAFASQVRKTAPNEHLKWLQGQYVEADSPNRNGAMWRSGELAIKSLTPVLMPITVMHDPRTAVGTIADTKLLTPEAAQIPRARIDTILAVWAHRFPDVYEEAAYNAAQGTLMQSMECFTPWYECSECGQVFHKQPHGAERAQWCNHLKASDPTGGYIDVAAERSTQAARILGDVCFTGTGLIFGSRGARGAMPTAHLSEWQDEVAELHDRIHTDTRAVRSIRMGVVQIDEAELKLLRDERDAAKQAETAAKAEAAAEAKKVEEAEAKAVAAEEKAQAAETKVTTLEETARQAELAKDRMSKLGAGFSEKLTKLPTVKSKLDEQAKSLSDADWDARLTEIEELAGVKRDAEAAGGGGGGGREHTDDQPTFGREELASIANGGGGQPGNGSQVGRSEQTSVIGSLASAFKPQKTAGKS